MNAQCCKLFIGINYKDLYVRHTKFALIVFVHIFGKKSLII